MATYRPLIVNAAANQIQELASGDSLTGITTVTATTFIGNVIGNVTGTATSFSGNGTIPVGGIIMWSGTIANIPTGWALCNGSNSTPDLRNKFVVSAGSDTGNYAWDSTTGAVTGNYAPGNTGGETAHQLTIAELASHSHIHRTASGNGSGTTPAMRTLWANLADSSDINEIQNTGSDRYHENRPPYYALAFIMRTL